MTETNSNVHFHCEMSTPVHLERSFFHTQNTQNYENDAIVSIGSALMVLTLLKS